MMKNKNYEIDFVKLLFAVGIVLFHSKHLAASDGNPIIFSKAYLGVEFFFMVSGYFMMSSIMRARERAPGEGSHVDFVKRKALRLYPYFLLSFALHFIIRTCLEKTPTVGKVLKSAIFSLGELSLLYTTEINFSKYFIHGVAWYVSSMIIAMFMLYPIIYKNPKRFSTYIAPIITILGYGLLSNNFKSLSVIKVWAFVLGAGVLRALIGLSLGTVVFQICHSIENSNKEITKLGRYAVSAVELMIFAVLLVLFTNFHVSEYKRAVDYTAVLLMFYLLIIIFAKLNCYHQIFSKKIFVSLSKLSTPLYFSHRCSSRILNFVCPENTFAKQLVLYLILAVLLSLLFIPVSKLIANTGRYLKNKLLQEKPAQAIEP